MTPVKKLEEGVLCDRGAVGTYCDRGEWRREERRVRGQVEVQSAARATGSPRLTGCLGPRPRTAGATRACKRPPPRVTHPPANPPALVTSSCLTASTPPLQSRNRSAALILCTPLRFRAVSVSPMVVDCATVS